MPGKQPKFLIVGAPKAGTTSLYRYLQQHPQIFMPENKEPRFFCNYEVGTLEFGKKHFHPDIVGTPEGYLALFDEAPPNSICGEASTDYLSCAQAARSIYSWNPSMKIIIMLRNPIDRAYSEYLHSIDAGFQRNTFWESLRLEEERIKEHYDPVFWHVRRGLYFDRVREYLQLFGSENVRTILFEDFGKSTQTVVKTLVDFLEVPDFPVDVAERYNVARVSPPRALRRISGSRIARPIVQMTKTVTGQPVIDRFLKRSMQGKKAGPQDVLTEKQYVWLKGQFQQDLVQLQELLNVDLSHWC